MGSLRSDETASSPFIPTGFTEFHYEKYAARSGSSDITMTYSLVGKEVITFTEKVVLPEPIADADLVRPVVKLLWLAAGLSYYKAAAPHRIVVAEGLTASERNLLSALLSGGLGEFAYRNNLPDALSTEIIAPQLTSEPRIALIDPDARPMVAVGGGKDSVVSIESCKALGMNPLLWSVNRYAAIDRCVEVSGCEYVNSTRSIDPKLFDINRAGAYNGHIPVTAINSLIGIVTSYSVGAGPVVMSNEMSANYANMVWRGYEINHQWSKTLQCENLLQAALRDTYGDPVPYFSLLRPLTELQIAERFSRYPRYFPAFTSCNRSFALNPDERATHWCRTCPKCLFVFLILAPFLTPEALVDIFGENILDREANEPLMAEILGYEGYKPFECVGDTAEARQALRMIADQPSWRSPLVEKLSARLKDFPDRVDPDDVGLISAIPRLYLAAVAPGSLE